jgi:hypothetical protein
MRNPLRTEAEAFRFLVVVIAGAVVIGVAAYLNTWVGLAAAIVVVGAIAAWLRRAPAIETTTTLTSSTPAGTHRVLILADSGTRRLNGVAGNTTDVIVVVPALASALEAVTGAVDDRRADAQATADALAHELNAAGVSARGAVGADDPLLAIEDALREFGADEIVLANGDDDLFAKARDRFALPVSRA